MHISLQHTPLRRPQNDILRETVQAFNSCQHEFELRLAGEVETPCVPLGWNDALVTWDTPDDTECRIVVTDVEFGDNWFAHANDRLGVISTHAWFDLFPSTCLQAYFLMEFAIACACFATKLGEEALHPHQHPRGCLFDMCGYKPDLILKLHAGHICGNHVGHLRNLTVSRESISAIERVIDLGRAYVLAREDAKRQLGAIRGRRVFVVHGRNTNHLSDLCGVIRDLRLDPIVIMDEPGRGQTVIEQIEANADVGFAIVLLTPDDEGRLRGDDTLKSRPRQNTVFEYGLFVGLLGRRRVCCLAPNEPMELPSDLAGVLQLRFQSNPSDARSGLQKELRAAGYPF